MVQVPRAAIYCGAEACRTGPRPPTHTAPRLAMRSAPAGATRTGLFPAARSAHTRLRRPRPAAAAFPRTDASPEAPPGARRGGKHAAASDAWPVALRVLARAQRCSCPPTADASADGGGAHGTAHPRTAVWSAMTGTCPATAHAEQGGVAHFSSDAPPRFGGACPVPWSLEHPESVHALRGERWHLSGAAHLPKLLP